MPNPTPEPLPTQLPPLDTPVLPVPGPPDVAPPWQEITTTTPPEFNEPEQPGQDQIIGDAPLAPSHVSF